MREAVRILAEAYRAHCAAENAYREALKVAFPVGKRIEVMRGQKTYSAEVIEQSWLGDRMLICGISGKPHWKDAWNFVEFAEARAALERKEIN